MENVKDFFEPIITFAKNYPQAFIFISLMVALYILVQVFIRPNLGEQQKKFKPKKYDLKLKSKYLAAGILFGLLGRKVLYSPADKEGHILCVGGSGMGKSTAVIQPTLFGFCHDNPNNSSFVIDLDGAANEHVEMPNKLVFEPLNPASIPYDVFGLIDKLKTDEEKTQALMDLALIIMPEEDHDSDGGKFYERQAQKILTACLLCYYFEGLDFVDCCYRIKESDLDTILTDVFNCDNKQAKLQLASYANGADMQWAMNAKNDCDDAISNFVDNPVFVKTFRRPNKDEIAFTPESVEKYNCFFIIPDDQIDKNKVILNIVVSQILNYLSVRTTNYDHQVLLCLDEGASFGFVPIIGPLRKFRKHGVRILFATQSITDIDITFGEKERRSMMANFRYKILLEASEPDDQEYWSRLAGESLQITHSQTSGVNDSSSAQETKLRRIAPDQFANLGNHLYLFYPGGFIKLRKNFFYKYKTNKKKQ